MSEEEVKLTWIKKYKRALRFLFAVLMLVAFLGPWVFDRVNVPAKYDCTPPFIRLEGDFCGLPLSGIQVFGWLFGGIFDLGAEIIKSETALSDIGVELLIALFFGLLPLPVLNTSLLILRGDRKGHQIFHIVICGLNLIPCLWLGIFNPDQTMFFRALWGFWLYTELLIGVLIFEIVVLRNRMPGEHIGDRNPADVNK